MGGVNGPVRRSVVKDPLAGNTAQGSELVLIKFSGNNPKAKKQCHSQQVGKRSKIQKSNRVQGKGIQNTESIQGQVKGQAKVKIAGRQSIADLLIAGKAQV